MIVDNPRRALEGDGVGPGDFPGLPVEAVVWTTTGEGLALDVQTSRPLTADEQATVRAVCQSVCSKERDVRERAERAMAGLEKIAGSTGTLTADQLSDAVRHLARCVLALVRLALRRLD